MTPITQATARAIIEDMAEALNMPDPMAARMHSRNALIDYARAYRRRDLAPTQTASLIESAWLHLEKAVLAGADRQHLEDLFFVIRVRAVHSMSAPYVPRCNGGVLPGA